MIWETSLSGSLFSHVLPERVFCIFHPLDSLRRHFSFFLTFCLVTAFFFLSILTLLLDHFAFMCLGISCSDMSPAIYSSFGAVTMPNPEALPLWTLVMMFSFSMSSIALMSWSSRKFVPPWMFEYLSFNLQQLLPVFITATELCLPEATVDWMAWVLGHVGFQDIDLLFMTDFLNWLVAPVRQPLTLFPHLSQERSSLSN